MLSQASAASVLQQILEDVTPHLSYNSCHQEGCFLGSIYYYTFVSNQVVLGLLLFVAAEMRRLKIKDQVGELLVMPKHYVPDSDVASTHRLRCRPATFDVCV
jgi:hypothetical protein